MTIAVGFTTFCNFARSSIRIRNFDKTMALKCSPDWTLQEKKYQIMWTQKNFKFPNQWSMVYNNYSYNDDLPIKYCQIPKNTLYNLRCKIKDKENHEKIEGYPILHASQQIGFSQKNSDYKIARETTLHMVINQTESDPNAVQIILILITYYLGV